MKIAIIGTGIAGLASAIRLASDGHNIDAYEANEYPGGKLTSFSLGKYRFDAGPSLFTMPEYIEQLFEYADVNIKDYFEYERLPHVCHYFWEDGTTLEAVSNRKQLAKDIESTFNLPKGSVYKAMLQDERKYQLTNPLFIEQSLHKVRTYLNFQTIKAIIGIPSLNIFTEMNKVNMRRYKHPKVVQLFNRFATYNGSDPYQASGIMTMIPHLENGIGTYFPKGGMHAITNALFELAKTKGVQFHFNSKVDEIKTDDSLATAIKVKNKEYKYDTIVSNMDVYHTYNRLLPSVKTPKNIETQERSSSALIFYWGIKKNFPELDVHNILFSEDYKQEFDSIFKEKTIFKDPTVYIHVSSKQEKNDAPDQCENWFVMLNVPANEGQNWEELKKQAKRFIFEKVKRVLKVDISTLIEEEKILDPITIEKNTQSYQGSLYGTSSNNRNAAFFRQANFSKKIKNLYFCGGSVHPGGGIPLCLMSGKITSEIIDRDSSK